jgi:predicted ATPase
MGVSATSRHAFNCASDCYAFLGRVLWLLGYPDQALQCSRRAVTIAEEISHPFSLAIALGWRAALHQLRREVPQTRVVAEAALALATEQIIPFFAAHSMALRGWALVEQGRHHEGIAQLRQGVEAYRATGADLESPHWLALLAEACGKAGEIEAGLGALATAFDLVARTRIAYYEAFLPSPIRQDEVLLGPGQRASVIVIGGQPGRYAMPSSPSCSSLRSASHRSPRSVWEL